MSPEELEYYRERARAERAKSIEAANRDAANIHARLVELYEALVQLEDEDKPRLHIVG